MDADILLAESIMDRVKQHKGFHRMLHRDTEATWTIGYGRNLDAKGVSEEEADHMLFNDLCDAINDARELVPSYDQLDPVRQGVLVEMAFSLGQAGLRTFRTMLTFITLGDFNLASQAMLDSKWARQVKTRAVRLAEALKTGRDGHASLPSAAI